MCYEDMTPAELQAAYLDQRKALAAVSELVRMLPASGRTSHRLLAGLERARGNVEAIEAEAGRRQLELVEPTD